MSVLIAPPVGVILTLSVQTSMAVICVSVMKDLLEMVLEVSVKV